MSQACGFTLKEIFNCAFGSDISCNVNAVHVNNFYLVNSIHDITYRYGFTEKAFNFQNNNFSLGGKAVDRVTASIQDSAGTNNADFSTPPDGQSGHMCMYLFTSSNPNRNGALENDVPAHENTQTTWVETTLARSGLIFFTMSKYAALVGQWGWSPDSGTNPDSTEGNIVYMHLFIDLLPLQPCNPTFYIFLFSHLGYFELTYMFPSLTACNAWLQADINRYNGTNRCLLWKTFVSKGLGVNAANNTNIPSDC
ncbi:Fungalysin metallopeptidase-domain-containing protein [Mycena olivaceomarginata]|nr:Fungalysin metallopeptidase-domain-containing protein [Mycena olivaceomarginata]